MIIEFALFGSCPYWILADPSAVADVDGVLMVDEGYVIDNYAAYLERVQREAFQGNLLLASSGVGRSLIIYVDETPSERWSLRPLLSGSYLRIPKGVVVCSMLHKLPVARIDRGSRFTCVPRGVYDLNAFSVVGPASKDRPDAVVILKKRGDGLPQDSVAPHIPAPDMEILPEFLRRAWSFMLGKSKLPSRED